MRLDRKRKADARQTVLRASTSGPISGPGSEAWNLTIERRGDAYPTSQRGRIDDDGGACMTLVGKGGKKSNEALVTSRAVAEAVIAVWWMRLRQLDP